MSEAEDVQKLKAERDVARKALDAKLAEDQVSRDEKALKISQDSRGFLNYDRLRNLPLQTLRYIEQTFPFYVNGFYDRLYKIRQEIDTKKKPELTLGKWDSEKEKWVT